MEIPLTPGLGLLSGARQSLDPFQVQWFKWPAFTSPKITLLPYLHLPLKLHDLVQLKPRNNNNNDNFKKAFRKEHTPQIP